VSLHCKRPGCGHVDGNHPARLDPAAPCLECDCPGFLLEDPATAKTDPRRGGGLLVRDEDCHKYALAFARHIVQRATDHGDTVEDVWVVVSVAAQILERAVVQACIDTGTLADYAAAREKLKRMAALIAATADVVEWKAPHV
jgi:hypothetical protein